jgi:hypothetical protein
MAVSSQLRHILDHGDETLRALMGQTEQAANIQFVAAATDPNRAEPVKAGATTSNGQTADAARAQS